MIIQNSILLITSVMSFFLSENQSGTAAFSSSKGKSIACTDLEESNLYSTDIACEGSFLAEAVYFGPISGGIPPYTLEWDNADTPGNDVYEGDGSFGISMIDVGNYYFIATDNQGCADTIALSIIYFKPPTYSLEIISEDCVGQQMGTIWLYNIIGPPAYYTFDWDLSSTPGNDDFGSPPATDDPQSIQGIEHGLYYLTITIVDQPEFPSYTCMYYDSILVGFRNIWTGIQDTLWENPSNWNCSFVPSSSDEAVIPANVPHFPTVNSQAFCYSILLHPTASIKVNPGNMLNVKGPSD